MGAIRKPNGDVRPLHDGTHYVHLNNNILFQDQLQYPDPEDAAFMVRHVQEAQEAMFGLSADISSAHRLVKIREKDWPLLGAAKRGQRTRRFGSIVWELSVFLRLPIGGPVYSPELQGWWDTSCCSSGGGN